MCHVLSQQNTNLILKSFSLLFRGTKHHLSEWGVAFDPDIPALIT